MPGRQIRDVLADAADHLAAAGVETPRVDAELLLAHLLHVPRRRLLSHADMSPEAVARLAELVTRRAGRTPLQHLTGVAPFRHLLLAVGPGVFIPRPETELLVDLVTPALRAAAAQAGRAGDAALVVDLCAGSGALGLAIADEVRGVEVTLVERSRQALRWLRRNAASALGVRVVAGDIRDAALLDELTGRVDVVVSNPPYVPTGAAVAPEVRADPPQAVFAGVDGLDLMASVMSTAARLLRVGGTLALEHDDTHSEPVTALLDSADQWDAIADHLDLTGRPRHTVAVRRPAPRERP